jgi:four helix bundle protein
LQIGTIYSIGAAGENGGWGEWQITELTMAKYQRFEDLPVWQEAKRLYNVVLDFLEEPNLPLTSGCRSQLDRAALSVSNNIAEGFERSSTAELKSFIAIARGSAGEVRSMMALVEDRPRLKSHVARLRKIRALAESCARQLTAWSGAVDKLPFEGQRHLPEKERAAREISSKAREFRINFLKNLKPDHPLYNSAEAREARG